MTDLFPLDAYLAPFPASRRERWRRFVRLNGVLALATSTPLLVVTLVGIIFGTYVGPLSQVVLVTAAICIAVLGCVVVITSVARAILRPYHRRLIRRLYALAPGDATASRHRSSRMSSAAGGAAFRVLAGTVATPETVGESGHLYVDSHTLTFVPQRQGRIQWPSASRVIELTPATLVTVEQRTPTRWQRLLQGVAVPNEHLQVVTGSPSTTLCFLVLQPIVVRDAMRRVLHEEAASTA